MRNIVVRTITFFVGVPALIAVILLLPHQNHLAVNVIAVTASALGARELSLLFGHPDTDYRASFVTIPLLGATIPFTQVLVVNGLLPQVAVQVVMYLAVAAILLLQLVRREDEGFEHALSNTAASITLLLYPGLFISYVVRMTGLQHAGPLMLTFLCMVFFNDTMAYLSGVFYRNVRERRAAQMGVTWKPRVVLPVSPKKTLVGFAGGLLMSPATLIAAHLLFPREIPGRIWQLALVGLAVGVATILGDLIESALKRSATRKDSGSLIPGRGGVLDSIDSVLYAAPVFFYLLGIV